MISPMTAAVSRRGSALRRVLVVLPRIPAQRVGDVLRQQARHLLVDGVPRAMQAHHPGHCGKLILVKQVSGQLLAQVILVGVMFFHPFLTRIFPDQVRYNFYVPPVLFDNQNAPQIGSFPIPSKPVTPFPAVAKYLPPDRAAEAPKTNCQQSRGVLAKPNPHVSKMLTIYGENFNKADPIHIFFGSEPSPYVEVRCTEVLGCLPPENQVTKRRPMIMVRPDGVIFPSNLMFP